MKLTLTIQMDNDAFQGTGRTEVSRILGRLADYFETTVQSAFMDDSRLRDSNGNTVGEWMITEEETP